MAEGVPVVVGGGVSEGVTETTDGGGRVASSVGVALAVAGSLVASPAARLGARANRTMPDT